MSLAVLSSLCLLLLPRQLLFYSPQPLSTAPNLISIEGCCCCKNLVILDLNISLLSNRYYIIFKPSFLKTIEIILLAFTCFVLTCTTRSCAMGSSRASGDSA